MAGSSHGDRVALVTGAASGIGRSVAQRLSDDGYLVVATDIDEAGAKETVNLLRTDKAFARYMDVSRSDSVDETVEQILESTGRIDALVCSAGVAGRSAAAWELSPNEWDKVVAINLTGVFLCCRRVAPEMKAGGWGRIVTIASIAGKEGNPNATPYSATKAGVIGFTKALAKELANTGVLVNSVTPAVIETPMLEQMSSEHVDYMVARIPMGRTGTSEEVAAMVSWLCSDECSFSTGAVFDISGGRATY